MKTLRVSLADIEGQPHGSHHANTNVTVTARYTGPVTLADGKIVPAAIKTKQLSTAATGYVDFEVYASDSPEVASAWRGFAITVTATITHAKSGKQLGQVARTVQVNESHPATVELGNLGDAEPESTYFAGYVRTVDGVAPDANGDVSVGATSVPNATTTTPGKVELATAAETIAGTDGARAVTPAGLAAALPAAVTAATEDATIAYAFGATQGVPISPWKPGPAIGPNFWQPGNFVTTSNYPAPAPIDPFASHNADGTMSITATGVVQEIRAQTRLLLNGNTINRDNTYRLEFDLDASAVPSGWWHVTVSLRHNSGDTLLGEQQRIATHNTPALAKTRHVIFDFKPNLPGSSFYVLEVRVRAVQNIPAGSVLKVENISVRQTGHMTPPLQVVNGGSLAGVGVLTTTRRDILDSNSPLVSTATELHAPTTTALNYIRAFGTDSPWPVKTADPMFLRATQPDNGSIGSAGGSGTVTPATTSWLRALNNDQIFQAKSLNGSYEGGDGGLYGNVHGGETNRVPTTYKADYGAGLVPIDMSADGLRECWRFQADWRSQIKTDTDPAPFAHVDHLMTFFPDGMMRMDRATTFQRDTTIRDVFEWMASYDVLSPAVGRVGRGLTVIGEVDYHPKVAAPDAPTVTPSAGGGALPAGSVSYRVTALSAHGETTPSPASAATATASGTAAVTWAAVSGATGYRVYGRTAGSEALLATVGPATLAWTDDGTAPATGLPPTVNTASTTGTTVWDSEEGEDVTWAVYHRDGWCQGNIYDRDSVLARDGIASVRTRLMNRPGAIQKNYANLFYDNDSYELTVPAGTVWTATHWSFVYRPRDPENYHDEIATRAASLDALKSIYPIA